MQLLIQILMLLGLYASPEQINDAEFASTNSAVISEAQTIVDNHWYREDDGGVVVIDIRPQ